MLLKKVLWVKKLFNFEIFSIFSFFQGFFYQQVFSVHLLKFASTKNWNKHKNVVFLFFSFFCNISTYLQTLNAILPMPISIFLRFIPTEILKSIKIKASWMYSHMLSKQFLKHTLAAFFSTVLGRKAHKKNFL